MVGGLIGDRRVGGVSTFAVSRVNVPTVILVRGTTGRIITTVRRHVSKRSVVLIVYNSNGGNNSKVTTTHVLLGRNFRISMFLVNRHSGLSPRSEGRLSVVRGLRVIV